MRIVIANAVSLITHVALLGGLALWSYDASSFWQVQVSTGRVITVQFSPAVQFEPAQPVTIIESPVESQTPPDELRVEVTRELAAAEVAELVVQVDALPSELPVGRPPLATKTEKPPEEPNKITHHTPRRTPTAEPPQRELPSIPPEFQAAAIAGADEPPRLLPFNPSPGYPLEALRDNIQGKVIVRLAIAADGTVNSQLTRIERSSGSPVLDNEALATVLRWRFSPARKRGVPVEYEVLKPFAFSIRRS